MIIKSELMANTPAPEFEKHIMFHNSIVKDTKVDHSNKSSLPPILSPVYNMPGFSSPINLHNIYLTTLIITQIPKICAMEFLFGATLRNVGSGS